MRGHYERAPCLEGSFRVCAALWGFAQGFAPAPLGFSALVPLPIGSLCEHIAKGDAVASPLHRSRPLSRRSGRFPAWPCPPLSSGVILPRRENRGVRRALKVCHF